MYGKHHDFRVKCVDVCAIRDALFHSRQIASLNCRSKLFRCIRLNATKDKERDCK